MRALIACALLLVSSAAACQSEGPRFVSESDSCSFAEISGWRADRDKGSLLLRDERSAATIAVRAVLAEGDWVEERTPALVNSAVGKILRALPQARGVTGPTPVRASLEGAVFEATFVPKGQDEPYLRRHVVFFGEDTGQIFHVILTVPAAEAEAGSKAFEQVVDSFREEV